MILTIFSKGKKILKDLFLDNENGFAITSTLYKSFESQYCDLTKNLQAWKNSGTNNNYNMNDMIGVENLDSDIPHIPEISTDVKTIPQVKHVFPDTEYLFLSFKYSHVKKKVDTHKLWEIHEGLSSGFGFKFDNSGNIHASRRCKTAVRVAEYTKNMINLQRPKCTRSPFTDETDKLVFDYQQYLTELKVF